MNCIQFIYNKYGKVAVLLINWNGKFSTKFWTQNLRLLAVIIANGIVLMGYYMHVQLILIDTKIIYMLPKDGGTRSLSRNQIVVLHGQFVFMKLIKHKWP